MDPTTTTARSNEPAGIASSSVPFSASSLEMNPRSGGMPAIDAAASAVAAATTGQRRPSPVRTRRSRVWVWWSITPTVRKSEALNAAWATSSTQPASVVSSVPAPNSTINKPSWLMVP